MSKLLQWLHSIYQRATKTRANSLGIPQRPPTRDDSPKEQATITKHVISKDGTRIVFDKSGQGQAIILVAGALSYRAFGQTPPLSQNLSQHFTVYTYDRRGRGDSTDTQPYAVEREIEDIEALINEIGGAVYLYGNVYYSVK